MTRPSPVADPGAQAEPTRASPPVRFLDLAADHAEVRSELDAAWRSVLERSAFVGGPTVERFEAEWATYCGRRNAIGVANGTDALTISLMALGIGPGDEVVVPALTFVATAEAVVAAGASPVFADVEPTTLLLSGESLRAALTPRTAAVVPVHLYGQPVDFADIAAVAAAAGLVIVEDAAQAHGATWDGAPVGGLGRVAGFSFYPGKNLGALGDAGAIVTDDDGLANAIRSLANHGRRLGSHYEHDRVGLNSRLDGLQAAVLSVKLRCLPAWTEARRRAAARYRGGLAATLARPLDEVPPARSSYHLFVVRHPRRDELAAYLRSCGIGTGLHYPQPCHRLAAFSGARNQQRSLPVAEAATQEILSLPLHPQLTPHDIDAVCAAIAAFDAGAGAPAGPGWERRDG